MSKNKPFRRFKFSENSLDGELLLEGTRIRLLFRFAPERVAFVKSIKGARYDGTTKTWSFPREQFEEFKKGTLFPEDRYPRRFSESALTQSLEEINYKNEQAVAAYKANPFSVPFEFLPFLGLDVIFSLAADAPQLRASVRFGSKATAILTRLKGAHFLRSEGRFVVPAESLAKLLTKLRDKGLSFAVEEICGQRLKESADLRKKILDRTEMASPEDLEASYLTPYVDFAENSEDIAYCLKYATSRHLAELFPDDENFHVRKKKSQSMTERDLLILLNRIHGLKYPLYISRAVRSQIERKGLQYSEAISSGQMPVSEELLPFLKTPCAWVVLSGDKAGLLIEESLVKEAQFSDFKFETFNTKRFYSCQPSRLFSLYLALSKIVEAQHTQAFKDLIAELAERSEVLKVNQAARESIDAEIKPKLFSDPLLPGKLFPHQRVAVKWLAEREYSLLGDDMGLGKTLSVIAAIDLLLNRRTISFALIVCPNSLTRNWLREVQRFLPGRIFLSLPELPAERKQLLGKIKSGIQHCDALVVNYERMRRPDVHQALSELLTERSSLICCDESQRVKNARSQTFLALRQLASLCRRRILLSGTPTPRDITDIWSQVLLLDSGKRFGSHYTNWLKSVAELGTQYSDYAVRKFKPMAVEETIARVHELLLRRRKEEVISLPEKTFSVRDCKLSGTQASRYKEVCEQLLLRISTTKGESFIKQIDNLLEEYLRAVQIASNPRLVDENWSGDPAKFLELDEIVDEVVRERGEKIIIWTNFIKNTDELLMRYQDLGARAFSGKVSAAQRDLTIEEFQNGTGVKVLIAVPAAGGVGITLTAAQTAVYLDKSWNAEHWLQSVDRIHRIGQRGTVSIISLSACKIDELISKNLARKSHSQTELLGDEERGAAQESQDLFPSREELIEALKE